mmetsp:Transcript_1770/g.2735  ORF Transcript_1770/g.2735 Transcript_1770/m.2735 type:complete len:229 (+) Transcript_1770:1036-1722(+)
MLHQSNDRSNLGIQNIIDITITVDIASWVTTEGSSGRTRKVNHNSDIIWNLKVLLRDGSFDACNGVTSDLSSCESQPLILTTAVTEVEGLCVSTVLPVRVAGACRRFIVNHAIIPDDTWSSTEAHEDVWVELTIAEGRRAIMPARLLKVDSSGEPFAVETLTLCLRCRIQRVIPPALPWLAASVNHLDNLDVAEWGGTAIRAVAIVATDSTGPIASVRVATVISINTA